EGIEVVELEVYKTIIKPVYMPDKPVSGILFYSPSAVEGFKRGEGFAGNLPPLFAIGPTTAKALKDESSQSVETAPQPIRKSSCVLSPTLFLIKPEACSIFNQRILRWFCPGGIHSRSI